VPPPSAVTVSNGLFSAALGGGTVTDGSGAGSYTSLAQVFRDYGAVWLGITVGGETLDPRVRVQSAAYALNATNLGGLPASNFLNTSSTAQTKTGPLTLDATASGGLALSVNAQFQGAIVTSNNSYAYLANNDQGVKASGTSFGGILLNSSSGTYANLATSGYGVQAYGGSGAGGFFQDGSGDTASIATGGYGVTATGAWYGGFFGNTCCSGGAYLGNFDYGVYAYGNAGGAYFTDSDSSGYAQVGSGDYGIYATGSAAGGSFGNSGVGQASLAVGDYGIKAYGRYPGGAAGYFKDSGYTGEAYLALGDSGILAYGNYRAAYFANIPSGLSVNLAFNNGFTKAAGIFDNGSVQTYLASNVVPNSGLWTNGTKNFVQNHPDDPTRSIAYACVEGDEVGTYTRGTARLRKGQAQVALGETFQWVTNPDIGLTAQLTSRGAPSKLYVDSLTTGEMVVKSDDPNAQDVEFDYQVNGLRIGFDDVPTTVPRTVEAPLPAKSEVDAVYAVHPELAATSARARFLAMYDASGHAPSAAGSHAAELEARIGFADPAAHQRALEKEASARPRQPDAAAPSRSPAPEEPAATVESRATDREAPAGAAASSLRAAFPLDGSVEAGDLLVVDPSRTGVLRRSDRTGDAAIVGVAVADPHARAATVLAVVGGEASCNVDATYGPIAIGSLLVTSPTSGRAMAMRDPPLGSVVGMALEAIDAGLGTIRVLVSPR